ncbi:MAG: epoxyqueuosine reductase [Nitrospinota bacterium]|nr:epoxyqueuosine reductase [Nitrospinota bacterium]
MSTTYTTSIEAAARIESLIKDFVENSPENSMRNSSGDKAWETPLVGFSSGADPLYEEYKDHVGPFHYTPGEIFNLTFPEEPAAAEDLTVISWVLPHLRATKLDNRRERIYPSERWARARIMGEEFIVLLRKHVVAELGRAGIQAVSPPLSPHWSREESPKYGFASRWSERHAAYASGLGTFGLCDGLITPVGKAHRLGSVVARVGVPPTPRPYGHHRAYCLHFNGFDCMSCAKRCPVYAVNAEGHDKLLCQPHVRETCGAHVKEAYGFEGYGCGLCQTGTPCESGIPKSLKGR